MVANSEAAQNERRVILSHGLVKGCTTYILVKFSDCFAVYSTDYAYLLSFRAQSPLRSLKQGA